MLAGRSGYRGKRRSEPRRFNPRENEKTTMLNVGRLSSVKYGLKEIMAHYKVDESIARTVMASVIAKSSRISIDSAVAYVKDQEKEGMVSHDVAREICILLDQNSKLR